MHHCALACQVIDKFLKILEVIVMEPGHAFKALLPSIINICMQEIYPIIAQVCRPLYTCVRVCTVCVCCVAIA